MKLIKNIKFKFLFFILLFLIFLSIVKIFQIKEMIVVRENTLILIKKGTTEFNFLKNIKKHNINISNFEWFLIKNLFNRNTSLRYGEYFINKDTNLENFQKQLYSGKLYFRKFTLIEGSDSRLLKLKLDNTFGLIGDLPRLKEGIYKPDTYNYKWGDTKVSLLKTMEFEQKKILKKHWPPSKLGNIIKSQEEVLILASIIEKETKKKEELELISSVFVNRLRKKMRLQSDVTVAFGLNILGSKLNKKNLKDKNPYNTYLNYGLPPTPICYPSEAAIKAALKPKKSNYLFFVTDGKGGHRFSNTYAKHKKNIQQWLKKQKENKEVK